MYFPLTCRLPAEPLPASIKINCAIKLRKLQSVKSWNETTKWEITNRYISCQHRSLDMQGAQCREKGWGFNEWMDTIENTNFTLIKNKISLKPSVQNKYSAQL